MIYLISETFSQDENGVMIPTERKRKVFGEVNSVTGSEWFEGGRNGLNPEYRILIFAPEYQGEEIVEYQGTRFTVYRTYTARNDVLELYCERRKGHASD